MALEDREAFFYTTVTVAPVTPTAGTTMTVDSLANAPSFPFHAVIRPANQIASSGSIGEVVLVTDYDLVTKIVTMTRGIIGSISITNGYVMYQYLGKTLDWLEYMSQCLITKVTANVTINSGTYAELTDLQIPFTLPTSMLCVIDSHLEWSHSGAAGVAVGDVFGATPRVDGVNLDDAPTYNRYQAETTAAQRNHSRRWTRNLAAGAHTISLSAKRFSGTGAILIGAGSTLSVEFRNSGNQIPA